MRNLDTASDEPLLRWFAFVHLPPHLQAISAVFWHVAAHVVEQCAPSRQREQALMQLLLAKDAAVRAAMETAEKAATTEHIVPKEG